MPIWLEGHPETYQKAVMKSLKQDFLIVPKPSSNNLDSEWSLHFPFAEKMILRNTKCAKPVIKLLKVKYHRLSKVSILVQTCLQCVGTYFLLISNLWGVHNLLCCGSLWSK